MSYFVLRRLVRAAGSMALAGTLLSGCSVFSPTPLWELVKAGGQLASSAISVGPSEASDTVRHALFPISHLCIEFNPSTPSTEIVPALQAELNAHQISSRVYRPGSVVAECGVWLHYSAYIDWGLPPFSNTYKHFLTAASLTLRTRDGKLLASSHYQLGGVLAMGKWTDTRSKLAPVVSALFTAPSNPPGPAVALAPL